jgi:hypothetical protein
MITQALNALWIIQDGWSTNYYSTERRTVNSRRARGKHAEKAGTAGKPSPVATMRAGLSGLAGMIR